MSFHVYIKFNPNLGPDGIAMDYSILGEENFQKILDYCEQTPPKSYLTRKDLGGIGLVDYLIIPSSFFDNPEELGVFYENENIYYQPLNIISLWRSEHLISIYDAEIIDMDEKDFISSYKLSIFDLFTETITRLKGSNHLFYIPIKKEDGQPFLLDRLEMLKDFPTIINSRIDLIFTREGLEYLTYYILNRAGVFISLDNMDKEKYVPLALRYLVQKLKSSKKGRFFVENSNPKNYFELSYSKGDIFLKKLHSLVGPRKSSLTYNSNTIDPLFYTYNLEYRARIFDFDIRDSNRNAVRPEFVGIYDMPAHELASMFKYIGDKFVDQFFCKDKTLDGLVLEERRMLGFELMIERLSSPLDFNVLAKVFYLGHDGFLKFRDILFMLDIDLKTSLYLQFLHLFKFEEMIENIQGIKFAYARMLENSYMCLEKTDGASNATGGLYSILKRDQTKLEPMMYDPKVRKANKSLGRFFEKVSYGLIGSRWNWEDFYDDYKSEYNRFILKVHSIISSRFEELSTRGFLLGDMKFTFDTTDQSLICNLNQGLEVIQVFIADIMDGLSEEEVSDFYITFINHLFEMQGNLVSKYGVIEYLLELSIALPANMGDKIDNRWKYLTICLLLDRDITDLGIEDRYVVREQNLQYVL